MAKPMRGGVHVAAAAFLRHSLKAFLSPPSSRLVLCPSSSYSYRPHESHAPPKTPLASQRCRRLGVASDHVVPWATAGAAGAASPAAGRRAPHRRSRNGLRDLHLGAAASYPAETAAATGSHFRPATADAGAALESGPAAAAVQGPDLLELLL
jgi:hypothetical protein